MIKELQEKINQTEYWDMEILDFHINYFGDEVTIIIRNDENTSWKISFSSCYAVNYQTDANWRTIAKVRDMKKPQLGYYGQNITLNQSNELSGFYTVTLDLTILTGKIVCKKIDVEKIQNSSISLFWEKQD